MNTHSLYCALAGMHRKLDGSMAKLVQSYLGQAAPRHPDGYSWGALCNSADYALVYQYRWLNAESC